MHPVRTSAVRLASTKLGWAWVGFCVSLALHVTDEALTGFLSVYNPTILAIRPSGWWFPPTFDFQTWLTGLTVAVAVGFAASPLFFRGVLWVQPLGYFLALAAGVLNALGHIAGTILGHTVTSVRFLRPMPGFYSSPFLLLGAVYLLIQLRASRASRREES